MSDENDQEDMTDDWAAAMSEQAEVEAGADEKNPAKPIELNEFDSPGSISELNNNPDLDVILDIPVSIAMEVGSTEITIRNLLQLNQGSVIELDRLAGEPLDVLVNGTLIAHGEVVVVNEKFGIRMTDVISPAERIKRLR